MELDATGQWSGLELRLADWERTGLLSDAAQDATGSLRRHPSLTAATKEALLEFGQSSEAVRAAFITLLSGHTNPMELGAHCSWSAFLSSDAAQAAMRLLGRHPSLAAVTKEALLEFGQISEAVRAAVIKILGCSRRPPSAATAAAGGQLQPAPAPRGSSSLAPAEATAPAAGVPAPPNSTSASTTGSSSIASHAAAPAPIAPGASATQASSPAIPFIALDSDDEQEPQLAPAPPPQPADPQPRGSASSEPSSQPAAAADSSEAEYKKPPLCASERRRRRQQQQQQQQQPLLGSGVAGSEPACRAGSKGPEARSRVSG
eukprot:tig00020830_g14476.t1